MKRALAIDIGASSGRAMLCTLEAGKITLQEIRRFQNEPVTVCGHAYWDILRLFHEVKQSIRAAGSIDSIGIDTWGVDYGLIDSNGKLLMNPYHYRDIRNDNVQKMDIYKHAGIQFMQFNTVYQLQHDDLRKVDRVLLIPDLLAYFLTDSMRMEYTNASTTNLLNAFTHELDENILTKANIDIKLFPKMIRPGESYGNLSQSICDELDVQSVPVVAIGTHDTASAVASIPAESGCDFVYISSGTWSLFGTVTDKPLVNEQSERLNFTNELGVDFRTRLLKNIMGLWLMQEIRKEHNTTFPALSCEACKEVPFRYIIDPDSDAFLGIGSMTKRIESAVGASLSMGELARCIYDSLALKYRFTLENLERITNKTYNTMYMFGGGIQDELLCQMTANACGIEVITCSSEATALGNAAVQLAEDIDRIPELMIRSTTIRHYYPTDKQLWSDAYSLHKRIFET